MFHVKKNSKKYDEKYFMMNLKVVQANKSLSQMAPEMHLYYISQWQLITPSNGQKHYKTAEKRPILRITCRLQMVSEIRDF